MEQLGADYDAVIWVTSAYLLAYAVPLLLAGRLGDRFGPKNLYLVGLAVFTAASLWCGLAGNIEMLIAARVVQGVGAALLTPQTLSTITRIFPPERRGVAISVWGATAGVATLVGPLAGGVLVDGLGWQWIFIVNVPIGIIGLGLAVLAGAQPAERRSTPSTCSGWCCRAWGCSSIVFALQEGQSHGWAPWIWGTIAGGRGVRGGVHLLAGGQPQRAPDPAEDLPRQRFQPVQRRHRRDRLRGDGDGGAGVLLRPGGVRAVLDPGGAADGADGRSRPVCWHRSSASSSTARTRGRSSASASPRWRSRSPGCRSR